MKNRIYTKIEKNSSKYISILLIIVFVLSLLPLFIISHYNFPACDDFSFTKEVKQIILQNGTVWNIIKQAFSKMEKN